MHRYTIGTYTSNTRVGHTLESWLQYYFHNPKNLDLIMNNLKISCNTVSNEISSTQINYHTYGLISLFSRQGQVISNSSRSMETIINENTVLEEKFDPYEVYLLQINYNTIITTLYKTEHSRSYHRNFILATAMVQYGYPKALHLLSAVVMNIGSVTDHSLRLGDNVIKIINFYRDLNNATNSVSNDLSLKIDVLEAYEVNIHKILSEALQKIKEHEFFQNNPTLAAKLMSVINDAKAFLYAEDENMMEVPGYCHANLRWNTLFELKNRLFFVCDYSGVYYGNILYDFALIISRLIIRQDKITKLLEYINSDDLTFVSKYKREEIRLKHLFIFILVDIINIIDRASLNYFDTSGSEKTKSTINLEHIESIQALLNTLEVEFRPLYTHPEHMLSNGKITLYDFANLHITYLSKIFEITLFYEERHQARLEMQENNTLTSDLDDIHVDIQDDEVDDTV